MQAVFKKNFRYKWLLGFLLLALVGTGASVYLKNSSEPVQTERTIAVERGTIQAEVAATGTISAVNTVEISSRVTGLITEVKVKENDHVQAGQVLVVLDDTSLQAQVDQYRAQLTNYVAIYERSKKLTAIGAQSVQQLDTDRTNYLAAQATYNNYSSQLDHYIIKAPVAGIVIGEPTPAGQTVVQGISAAQVLMKIADMSRMQIKVQIDETDIGKVRVGQTVAFTVDAYSDKIFTGKVKRISKDATTTSNVVYYPVYVDVESPQGLLYPTMTARVTIKVGESTDTLIVPLSAIKEEKGQKYVQLIDGQKVVNRAVKTGLSDDSNIEILSGVSKTEQVVIPAVKVKTTTSSKQQGPPPPL